jgi:hypothetical protein
MGFFSAIKMDPKAANSQTWKLERLKDVVLDSQPAISGAVKWDERHRNPTP